MNVNNMDIFRAVSTAMYLARPPYGTEASYKEEQHRRDCECLAEELAQFEGFSRDAFMRACGVRP